MPVSGGPLGNDVLATLIIGTVTIYLFRPRASDVVPPVGDLVVVEQDDGSERPVPAEVPGEPHMQPLTLRELGSLALLLIMAGGGFVPVQPSVP